MHFLALRLPSSPRRSQSGSSLPSLYLCSLLFPVIHYPHSPLPLLFYTLSLSLSNRPVPFCFSPLVLLPSSRSNQSSIIQASQGFSHSPHNSLSLFWPSGAASHKQCSLQYQSLESLNRIWLCLIQPQSVQCFFLPPGALPSD